eukprot:128049-Pleurochrysis_carterae.AAC.2
MRVRVQEEGCRPAKACRRSARVNTCCCAWFLHKWFDRLDDAKEVGRTRTPRLHKATLTTQAYTYEHTHAAAHNAPRACACAPSYASVTHASPVSPPTTLLLSSASFLRLEASNNATSRQPQTHGERRNNPPTRESSP